MAICVIKDLTDEMKEGRKEMSYLTTHSTHCIYDYFYGVRHMVKDHLDSEGGNPLPSRGLLFPIRINVGFLMHHPTDRITHTTAFVTPRDQISAFRSRVSGQEEAFRLAARDPLYAPSHRQDITCHGLCYTSR